MSHPFLPLIADTLKATDTSDVLRIGHLPWPEGATACQALPADARTDDIPTGQLAIAALPITMSRQEARRVIAALRDIKVRQLLVFVPENLLDGTALLGLGLCRQARYEVDDLAWHAWSFDIRHYKPVPDWLNPKFWANPENWDKYRW
ncbi:MAG: DUF6231 family protein [Moraxellaceae bacterium]|nr:DUF6231 family protein [Moraxellaceae bacterium]